MTVTSTTSRVDYVTTGATDTFAFPFRILSEEHLLVVLDGETLELDTDYTVEGVGLSAGGSIVLVDGNPEDDLNLSIRRVVPLLQETDIKNLGTWRPETHEDVYDLLVMMHQQQQDEIDRAVQAGENNSDLDLTLPEPSAGQALVWNDDEDGLVNFDLDEFAETFATEFAAGTVIVDTFEPPAYEAGVSTSLNLTAIPWTKNNTRVFFDGVFQHRDTYSVSDTTITFDEAIPIGTLQVEIEQVSAREVGVLGEQTVQTGALEDGAVTTPKLATDAVTATKIADGAVTVDHLLSDSLAAAGRNFILNGCGEARFESAAASFTDNVFRYGDTINCKARIQDAGGTATGAIMGRTDAPFGSGIANRASAVTLAGAGTVKFRWYVEAAEARALKNRTATLSAKVYHDVGANVDWTMGISKADVADTFGAVTAVHAGVAEAVPTATATRIVDAAIAMGDCSNGFYVEFTATLPTGCTNKAFYITEVKLEVGSEATDYEYEPVALTFLRLRRHFQMMKVAAGSQMLHGFATSTTEATFLMKLSAPMRLQSQAGLVGSDTSAAASWAVHDGVTEINATVISVAPVSVYADENGQDQWLQVAVTVAAGLTQFRPYRLIGRTGAGSAQIVLDRRF